MTWISPRTWTTGEVVTASNMNGIRDNLTELWKGTTAGDLEYFSESNQKARLGIGADESVLVASGIAPVWSLPQYASLLKVVSAQSIPNNTLTEITSFDEFIDIGGFHEGTNNYVTIPSEGLYIIEAWAYFNGHASSGTLRQLGIKRDSDIYTSQSHVQDSASNPTHINLVHIWRLTGGTTIKLVAYQSSGGNLNLNNPYLNIARIR